MNEVITRYGITVIVNDDRMVVIEGKDKNFFIVSNMTTELIHNYFALRREICPYEVNLHDSDDADKLMRDEVYGFIEELSGKWYSTKGIVFCFELEIDAVAFKLRWL